MALESEDQYSTAAVFTAIFVVTYFAWNRLTRINGEKKLPPSVGHLPIIGSLPFLPDRTKLQAFFLEKAYTGMDVMSFEAGGKYMVILSSYEAIRDTLVKQSVETADRPNHFINKYAINPKNKGIVSANYNNAFKKIHQLSLSILKEFGFGQRVMEGRITNEVEDLIKNFKELNSEPVYPKPLVAASVLSVISSIVLGDRLKDQELNKRIGQASDDMTRTSMDLFPTEFIHSLVYLPKFKTILNQVILAQQHLLDLAEKTIRDCESECGSNNNPTESFISNFRERQGAEFDREELQYTTRDLLLAGFETSSTTLLWALLHLANRSDIQEKLQSEIDSVVPRDRFPSLDDKSQLLYVEAFILEVMRRNTLVPLSVPRAALDDVTIGEYVIPKGATIMPNLYAVHMNKNTWGDPEIFRPERFLDGSGVIASKRERVIPFSVGKRSCLGELLARQEIFLFITGLLQHFHIRPPEGVEHIDAKEVIGFTISPEPFNIIFIPRC